jgi:sporulation protein YlmC with PRC-barrel domain
MRLRDDDLIGLRVETTAGEHVGRVIGFVMDTDGGMIVQYRVRPPGLLAALLPGIRELLIHSSQVVSIDTQRMIVESGQTSERAGGRRRRTLAPSPHPQPLTAEQEQ